MATEIADPAKYDLRPLHRPAKRPGFLCPRLRLHSWLEVPTTETRVSMIPQTFSRFLPALCAALLLAGCSEPVSMNNYNRIETDMTEARVYEILGEPDSAESIELGGFSGTLATWEGKKAVITIQIFNGEVFGKQYSSKSQAKPHD